MPASTPGDGVLRPSPLASGLHEATYPGGLRLLVQEDHRQPVAVCNVWVRVGSNREPEELRGWSHGIEHMLFKGTGRRDEGDFAREVAEAGGATNAGTGYETTNYHITVPATHIDVAVDLLADALFDSAFDPASLDAERQVLVHENHMYDDIPFGFGLTWRWGLELAFDVSPYRHPIGGRDENLLARSREDIVAFWRSAYRPDNMTVVVVGAVDPAAVAARVAATFPVAAGAGPAPVDDPRVALVAAPPLEPERAAPRCRLEHGDIKKCYAKLVFPTPGDGGHERHVLSVVRRVLSDGRSCRLHRRVQEELQLVDEFTVMSEGGPREGVLVIDLETDAARLAPAVTAVLEICRELARDGCTAAELDRAATRVLRSHVFGSETVQGQAANLGYHDARDELPRAFSLPDEVAAVTAADVAGLASRIFHPGRLAAVIYLPAGTDAAAAGIPTDDASFAALATAALGEHRPGAAAASRRTPVVSAARAARPAAAPAPFTRHRLAGGAEVWLRRDPSLPVVSLAVTVPGGATGETAADAGLAALGQAVQVKGARGRSAATIHAELEGDGASISPRAQRDHTGLSLAGLAGRLERALDTLADLILAPDFPDSEVEQERRLALEQLAALQDNPFQAAALRLRELVYGDHPYGRPLIGTPASLPRLERGALLARHRAAWHSADLQITVSGDLDEDALLRRLEDLLADLPAGEAADDPRPGPARRPDGPVIERLTRQQNQSVVLVAWPGPLHPDERRAPLALLREVLNGQSGRLFESLRNRRSLCYNTGVLTTAGFGQGMVMGYVLTAPETADEAGAALVAEIARLRDEPVAAAEFERARSQLLGQLLIAGQTNGARVGHASGGRVYGRGPQDLENLVAAIGDCTPAQVAEAAQALILPDSRFQVILGP